MHIELYVRIATEATRGVAMPRLFGTDEDWPAQGVGNAAWTNSTSNLMHSGEQLAKAIEAFLDARLQHTAPGREYDFYFLFHGIVQHSLYHGGQIAILKKAFSAAE